MDNLKLSARDTLHPPPGPGEFALEIQVRRPVVADPLRPELPHPGRVDPLGNPERHEAMRPGKALSIARSGEISPRGSEPLNHPVVMARPIRQPMMEQNRRAHDRS